MSSRPARQAESWSNARWLLWCLLMRRKIQAPKWVGFQRGKQISIAPWVGKLFKIYQPYPKQAGGLGNGQQSYRTLPTEKWKSSFPSVHLIWEFGLPEECWLHTPLPSDEVLLKICNAPEKTWEVVTLTPLYLGRNHLLHGNQICTVSCLLPAFSRPVWWHGPGHLSIRKSTTTTVDRPSQKAFQNGDNKSALTH